MVFATCSAALFLSTQCDDVASVVTFSSNMKNSNIELLNPGSGNLSSPKRQTTPLHVTDWSIGKTKHIQIIRRSILPNRGGR